MWWVTDADGLRERVEYQRTQKALGRPVDVDELFDIFDVLRLQIDDENHGEDKYDELERELSEVEAERDDLKYAEEDLVDAQNTIKSLKSQLLKLAKKTKE